MGHQTKTITRRGLASALIVGVLLIAPAMAEANVVRGVGNIIAGVLHIPLSVLAGTFGGPPILGTALGAINGTIQGLGMVASGALELALDGVAVAKTAAPFVLPFLF